MLILFFILKANDSKVKNSCKFNKELFGEVVQEFCNRKNYFLEATLETNEYSENQNSDIDLYSDLFFIF